MTEPLTDERRIRPVYASPALTEADPTAEIPHVHANWDMDFGANLTISATDDPERFEVCLNTSDYVKRDGIMVHTATKGQVFEWMRMLGVVIGAVTPAAVLPALPKDDRGATQAAEVAPCGCPVHHHRMRVTKHTRECSKRIGAAEFDAGYEPEPADEPTPDAAPVVAEEAPAEAIRTCRRCSEPDPMLWHGDGEHCAHGRQVYADWAAQGVDVVATYRDAAPAVGPAATDGPTCGSRHPTRPGSVCIRHDEHKASGSSMHHDAKGRAWFDYRGPTPTYGQMA